MACRVCERVGGGGGRDDGTMQNGQYCRPEDLTTWHRHRSNGRFQLCGCRCDTLDVQKTEAGDSAVCWHAVHTMVNRWRRRRLAVPELRGDASPVSAKSRSRLSRSAVGRRSPWAGYARPSPQPASQPARRSVLPDHDDQKKKKLDALQTAVHQDLHPLGRGLWAVRIMQNT